MKTETIGKLISKSGDDFRAGSLQFAGSASSGEFQVTVVFTTPEGTKAALRAASRFAHDLAGEIRLVAAKAVPWQLPLQEPPVPVAFLERELCGLVCEAGIVEQRVRIQLYLCRDRHQVLRKVLGPHSLVVIGGPNHWWSRRERNLKSFLKSLGHRVILVRDLPIDKVDRPSSTANRAEGFDSATQLNLERQHK